MSTSQPSVPDLGLSEEQRLLRDEVRRFAEEEIRPGVAERDRTHEFPAEIFKSLAEMGLLGVLVDEKFGGAGLDASSYVIAVEELARVCPSVAVCMSVTNSVCCWPIDRFGSEDLKSRVLPSLASGTSLGGFGLTEPGSGSDAASMKTTAILEDDEWILNGEKAWITNAGIADFYVVLARTDIAAGKAGLSAFVVPGESPGLSIGPREEKLGLRASVTGGLRFDNCRVPNKNVLGELGQGWQIVLATLDHSRLGIAAQAVGIHQRALDLAIDYAKARVQFGVPIAQHQAIRFKIAEMSTQLEASRLLTWYAAASEATKDAGRRAAEAKLFASLAANKACATSLQIHGGNGFSDEYEISKLYRDGRVTTIYEGTSEMQRLVIARHLTRS
jgi:alkylation response protein AidB-like acyl-CoA dehydrogenase